MMLKLKLQYFGHLMRRVDSLEKTLMLGGIGGRRRRGHQRMRWLDGITDLMHEFGWTLGVDDGQGGLVCCDSWGRKELDTTEWLNWTELNWILAHDIFSCGMWTLRCSIYNLVPGPLHWKHGLLTTCIIYLTTICIIFPCPTRTSTLQMESLPTASTLPSQFSSVAQSCPTLWDPMDCSMPGLPVHRQIPEFTQDHQGSPMYIAAFNSQLILGYSVQSEGESWEVIWISTTG